MKLYLVRHGLAKLRDEDPRQSLNNEGEFMAKQIGNFLSQLRDLRVTEIRHSPKERAKQTAQLLAEYLKQPIVVKETSGLEPMAEVRNMAEEIKTEDHDLLLVGHLPFLTRLASQLMFNDPGHDVFELPPAGVICLERLDEVDTASRWVLRWMITPEQLSQSPLP